nr:TPA_inf: spike protein [Giant mudskipper bafinivirus]
MLSFPYTLLLLSLLSLTYADYNIRFDSHNLNWVNCYDLSCTTWQACPTSTESLVCLKFTLNKAAYYVDNDGKSIGTGNVADVFLVITMKQQSSYVFSSGKTIQPPTTSWSPTPYVRTPDCISKMDTHLDPTCPTTTFYQTNKISDLPDTHRCLASLQGYGSVYNTICEPYASQLSTYYTINQPTSPVFTDFGQVRASKSLGCYYENWSKYRPGIYKADTSYLQGCDVIYFFVNVLADRQGNIAFVEREEGDWATIQTIKEAYPTAEVALTFGGWTSNNTIMYQAMTSHKAVILPQILALADRLQISLDFDVEFPGASNGLTDVFPLDFPSIVSFMKDVCDHQHASNRRCFWGGLGVGSHFHEQLILQLSQTSGVDQFNMFGYDLHGPWEPTMEHQNILSNARGAFPNYTLVDTVLNFKKLLPVNKLSLGFPLYGRGALVSASGTVKSAWPTVSPMLAAGESGSDLIVLKNGIEVPSIYDPSTDTITSDVPGYYVLTRPVGADFGKIYFSNSTTFELIVSALDSTGLTSYFTYASTMSKYMSSNLNKILKRTRTVRSLAQTVYYQFPSSGSSVTQCNDIVAFTPDLVVSTAVYSGCHTVNSASSLCFYKRSTFTCSPGTTKTVMSQSQTLCSGLNSHTLLPSNPQDVSVVCADLTLSVQQVSICQEPSLPTSPIAVEIGVPSNLDSWPVKTIPLDTEFITKTQAIELPYACDNITALPTCKEMLCGADTTCYNLVSTPAMTEYCNALGFHIQAYNQAVDRFQTEHTEMTALFDELSDVAVTRFGYHTAVATRQRRNLAGIGFGLLGSILGVVSIGIGVKNSVDISKLRSDLTSVQVTSESNFKAIKNAFDSFQSSTAAALREQSSINAAFDTNFKRMQEFVTNNFNGVASKFKEIDTAISQVVSAVNTISDTVEKQKVVAASSDVAAMRVSTALDLLTSNRQAVGSTTAQLRVCLASLRTSSLAGCVAEGVDAVPLSVKPYTTGNTKGLLFLYMTRKTVGTVTLKSTTTFCNDSTLYIASPDCFFYNNDTVIYHTNRELQTCTPPLQLPVSNCPSAIYQLAPHQSSIQLGFTSIPVLQPPRPELNVTLGNFTLDELQDLIGYNATAFENAISQLESIQLQLQSLNPPSSGYTTYQILTISALSIAIFGTLIGFFSTFYSFSLKSSIAQIFKAR